MTAAARALAQVTRIQFDGARRQLLRVLIYAQLPSSIL